RAGLGRLGGGLCWLRAVLGIHGTQRLTPIAGGRGRFGCAMHLRVAARRGARCLTSCTSRAAWRAGCRSARRAAACARGRRAAQRLQCVLDRQAVEHDRALAEFASLLELLAQPLDAVAHNKASMRSRIASAVSRLLSKG